MTVEALRKSVLNILWGISEGLYSADFLDAWKEAQFDFFFARGFERTKVLKPDKVLHFSLIPHLKYPGYTRFGDVCFVPRSLSRKQYVIGESKFMRRNEQATNRGRVISDLAKIEEYWTSVNGNRDIVRPYFYYLWIFGNSPESCLPEGDVNATALQDFLNSNTQPSYRGIRINLYPWIGDDERSSETREYIIWSAIIRYLSTKMQLTSTLFAEFGDDAVGADHAVLHSRTVGGQYVNTYGRNGYGEKDVHRYRLREKQT